MTSQKEKAKRFADLHKKGDPLVLFNIWDAGSARAVAGSGAHAIATGSHSVAEANGFEDGEHIPIDLAIETVARIVNAVDLPVTLDFEGGYATKLESLGNNIEKVLRAGVVGINFEDQIVAGEGLYPIAEQARRIRAVRETAAANDVELFINARTDVFLKTYPNEHTPEQLDEALERAAAYHEAGASGLFAPGLRDRELIRQLCEHSPLPVNILVLPDVPSNDELASLGVARISYGPAPFRQMLAWLMEKASGVYRGRA